MNRALTAPFDAMAFLYFRVCFWTPLGQMWQGGIHKWRNITKDHLNYAMLEGADTKEVNLSFKMRDVIYEYPQIILMTSFMNDP